MAPTERLTFYDQHPFDWIAVDEAPDIGQFVSRPLIEMIDSLDPNAFVLDIGCGPGRVLGFLAQRRIRAVGVDRSRVSASMVRERYDVPCAVGDNLNLPFADAAVDVVISDGVIHHTDDPAVAFAENSRVLKTGGQMYLAVYKPYGRYPWLYKYPGAVIRRGLRHSWSKPLVIVFAMLPYYLFHFARSKGKRTWAGARNLFYDYFVTPKVDFLARSVIEDWCSRAGLRVESYDENRGGNVHSFRLLKVGKPSTSHTPVAVARADSASMGSVPPR
jgi:SAM-dependent methyltransferase